jgi:hypothetical protein
VRFVTCHAERLVPFIFKKRGFAEVVASGR